MDVSKPQVLLIIRVCQRSQADFKLGIPGYAWTPGRKIALSPEMAESL